MRSGLLIVLVLAAALTLGCEGKRYTPHSAEYHRQVDLLWLEFKRKDFDIEERLERIRIAAPDKYNDVLIRMTDVQVKLAYAEVEAIQRLRTKDSTLIAQGKRRPDHDGDCEWFDESPE